MDNKTTNNIKSSINPFENIDFKSGIVTHIENDFSQEYLREDMLQVIYPKDYLLDVGWYRTNFTVLIIKNCDWENPITVVHSDILNLHKTVICAVEVIEKMIIK
jgi:hypothetical protein